MAKKVVLIPYCRCCHRLMNTTTPLSVFFTEQFQRTCSICGHRTRTFIDLNKPWVLRGYAKLAELEDENGGQDR
jgi:hypothetical protein